MAAPATDVWGQPAVPCADCAHTPFTPFMLGDFTGPVANLFSDVKIAEGESPRPMDRVFYKYNYFNNLEKTRWNVPTEPIHNIDLFRNTFGMEKTFFDEKVSLGVRVPFNTIDAESKDFHLAQTSSGALVPSVSAEGFDTTQFGNLSVIAKAVLWENRQTGDLLSAGATLSFPTASSKKINPGMSILAFMQPFAGFIVNRGDLFVQGFTSITIPVASSESIVLFNDLGVGYYLYRNPAGMVSSVAPTLEIHFANPLRQADPNADQFGFKDDLKLHNEVNVTVGATTEFTNRATLGMGLVLPLAAPRPFDMELIAQLNYRF